MHLAVLRGVFESGVRYHDYSTFDLPMLIFLSLSPAGDEGALTVPSPSTLSGQHEGRGNQGYNRFLRALEGFDLS